jgi:lysophospholipase L1-like esterase
VDFSNLTTNGGTSGDLRNDVESSESTRAAIADADVIIISTGANDMEPAFLSWVADTCGGDDQLDCFREIAVGWEENFDAILTEIDGLREGQPTAIRILTNANEFLSDPGLRATFGVDFGLTGGATITALHHDALCAAAERHAAVCVDLRPVLNGPDFSVPANVNSSASMQLVADALLASGLDELGTTG